ncbi:dihydrodipicolinate reductase [Achromatium sp. WMS1]|nr:dihydrodipicolinate reductase [Achromatium sp. WMS1]
MIRIAVSGAAGRMGKTLIQAIANNSETQLVAATENITSNFLGVDAGELAGIGCNKILISNNKELKYQDFDVLIDFTTPSATLTHVAICKESGKRLVIGTTGLNDEDKAQIAEAATRIPIVLAPNMSIGVNLCFKLLEIAAQIIGAESDIEIIEAHHNKKTDAPSGTALRMGEVIANKLGYDLKQIAVYGHGREGHIGPRIKETIGFATIRAADIAGEHSVWFAMEGERVEINHKALNRLNFARGALRAARWLMQHQRGLYDMQDVLGLKTYPS